MAFFGFKNLTTLSNTELTLYRYISMNSEKVVYMRIRDIAKETHVSNTSVMRFIHKIGFSSFPEFKAFLKNHPFNSNNNVEFDFINRDNFPTNIQNTIQLVANSLYQSDNIVFLGMGSSAIVAEYASRQLASIGYNTSIVNDPFYPLYERLRNTTNTALICLSVSGETPELVERLNSFINDEDTTIISITSNSSSKIALMSRYVLNYKLKQYRIHRYYDLSSQIPTMYIVENLIKALHNRSN